MTQLQTTLKQLRLSGLAQTLDVRLQEAGAGRLGHGEFLLMIDGWLMFLPGTIWISFLFSKKTKQLMQEEFRKSVGKAWAIVTSLG